MRHGYFKINVIIVKIILRGHMVFLKKNTRGISEIEHL